MKSILNGLQHYFFGTGDTVPLRDGRGNVLDWHPGQTQDSLSVSSTPLFNTENTILWSLSDTRTLSSAEAPIGALSGPRGGTVSLWFRETTGSGHGATGGWICFRRVNTDTGNVEYQFALFDGEYVLNIFSSSDASLTFPSSVGVGTTDWHHALFGFDPSLGRAFLSIDGEPVVYSNALDTGMAKGAVAVNRFSLGTANWNLGGTRFNGSITQPITWDRALTREEMLYLYNDGQGRSRNQIFAPLDQEYDPHLFSIASAIPTLSLPGVIDITATSARPQVTLTY